MAEEIIGKFLVYRSPRGRLAARIVEVEAYIGQDDPACHASRGMTPRNRPMFGPPGHSYIYFVYGMYHCLNFVTEPENQPAAVLLRAAEPVSGMEIMRELSPGKDGYHLLNGPGKFCRSFGLTTDQNELDLTGNVLYIEDRNYTVSNINRSPRIGIKEGTERLWRFYDAGSPAVSRMPKAAVRKGKG